MDCQSVCLIFAEQTHEDEENANEEEDKHSKHQEKRNQ